MPTRCAQSTISAVACAASTPSATPGNSFTRAALVDGPVPTTMLRSAGGQSVRKMVDELGDSAGTVVDWRARVG
jgi:hypothetical protein